MVVLAEIWGSIQDFVDAGGPVLYAVAATLILMWTVILERFWYMRIIFPGRRRAIVSSWESRVDTTSWYAKRIREQWISEANVELKAGLALVKVCVAVCPLLGLLGTVTGMILVFDVMATVGTGNPRAMASGVSKATIPTMAGMVAALSGIYFSDKLQRTADEETEKLEDLMQHH